MCRDGIRKAKTQVELILEMEAKNNKKGFYRYISQKRKAKENVPSLVDENAKLLTTDMEEAEVFSNFSASVFAASQTSQVFLFP